MQTFRVLKNGKRPLLTKFLEGEDESVVKEWVDDGGNYGVLTGDKHNLIVLDLDNHKENQATGYENLCTYMEKYELTLPETYTVLTPSGGIHYYFTIPDEFKGKKFSQNISQLSSVDFQHDGRYVVGTGSKINDNLYQLITDVPMEPAPEWLLSIFLRESTGYKNGERRPNKTAQTLNFMVTGVSEGGRNIWLTQLTGKLLATGAEVKTVAHMVKLANENFVNPPVDKKELQTIFKSVLAKEKRI